MLVSFHHDSGESHFPEPVVTQTANSRLKLHKQATSFSRNAKRVLNDWFSFVQNAPVAFGYTI
jgi:hypothetical protein